MSAVANYTIEEVTEADPIASNGYNFRKPVKTILTRFIEPKIELFNTVLPLLTHYDWVIDFLWIIENLLLLNQ